MSGKFGITLDQRAQLTPQEETKLLMDLKDYAHAWSVGLAEKQDIDGTLWFQTTTDPLAPAIRSPERQRLDRERISSFLSGMLVALGFNQDGMRYGPPPAHGWPVGKPMGDVG